MVKLQCDTVVSSRNAEPWLIAVLNQDDEPLALLPLCIEPHFDPDHPIMHLRVLKFVDGGLSDYNAPVLFPAVAEWDIRTVRRIWRGIRRALPRFDVGVLEKMPERVGDLPNPFRLFRCEPEPRSGHAIRLCGTWETFASQLFLHRKDLRELERNHRRLSRLGEPKLEIAKTPEQYDAFREVLSRQKRRRDLDVRGHDSFLAPGYTSYLDLARRHLYPSGPVCMFALKVNERIIATQFGVVAGNRYLDLVSGFEDEEWGTYSPGHILIRKVIEWCFDAGVNVFDFGGGDEGYKYEYSSNEVPLSRTVIPSTPRGYLFLHTPKTIERLHRRRTESWREMGLAMAACSVPAEVSSALAHARKSWALWPSPARTRELLAVTKAIRAHRSR